MAQPKAKETSTNENRQKTMYTELLETTGSDKEALYILFKYAPELMPTPCKSFDELKKKYVVFANAEESKIKKYEYREDVQRGIRKLLKALDSKRDIELYNKYYELALGGNVNALKAYMDFKKEFFAEAKKNEIESILANTNLEVIGGDDDVKMEI